MFVIVGLHPDHEPERAGTPAPAGAEHRPPCAPVTSPPTIFPVTNSATARRSGPLRRDPCSRMAPVIRLSITACGVRALSASRPGARESAAPLWQGAQLCLKISSPLGDCADTEPEMPVTSSTQSSAIEAVDSRAVRVSLAPRDKGDCGGNGFTRRSGATGAQFDENFSVPPFLRVDPLPPSPPLA